MNNFFINVLGMIMSTAKFKEDCRLCKIILTFYIGARRQCSTVMIKEEDLYLIYFYDISLKRHSLFTHGGLRSLPPPVRPAAFKFANWLIGKRNKENKIPKQYRVEYCIIQLAEVKIYEVSFLTFPSPAAAVDTAADVICPRMLSRCQVYLGLVRVYIEECSVNFSPFRTFLY